MRFATRETVCLETSRGWQKGRQAESTTLTCPETLFISHESASFRFSVFRMVRGEAKTAKIKWMLQ